MLSLFSVTASASAPTDSGQTIVRQRFNKSLKVWWVQGDALVQVRHGHLLVNADAAGGKIQFISDCGGGNILTGIKTSIDHGAAACYVHGAVGDRLARQGDWDLMAKALELIRSNGVPAGIGGHRLETISGSIEHGPRPDFWMKTLHQTNYWSFRHTEKKDNKYCDDPDSVISYMKNLEQPWIAFKTLAAGAIRPKDAFHWCFESGADFICVGMYDFQLVEDVNLACVILSGDVSRKRPWRA